MNDYEHIIGIDEAGRGPLAGPVAVGAFAASADFDMQELSDITDSKKLTESQRDEWLEHIQEITKEGGAEFTVRYREPAEIDTEGIGNVIQDAIREALESIEYTNKEEARILLDGRLTAPSKYKHQNTITKGDIKEPVISAASICAKVLRDRKMKEYHTKWPQYGFDSHKGYPTPRHYEALKEYGPCDIHRKSYLT